MELRSLLKADACFSFTFAAIHVPGRNNGIADTLSRFNFQAFHSQALHAKKFPILIPVQLFAQLSIGLHLKAHCLSLMHQGLAPSTRRTYSCAQEKFVNFCVMTGHLSPYGSPCPAFATYLADSLRHSSI